MEITIGEALHKAIDAHKAGRVELAQRLYKAILSADPKHPDANHNSGILAIGLGQLDVALPFLKAALEVNPSITQYWLSYIGLLIQMEHQEEAREAILAAKRNGVKDEELENLKLKIGRVSITQNPPHNHLQSLINLHNRGLYDEALEKTNISIKKYPMSHTLHNIKGILLANLGKLDLSMQAYSRAIFIKPDFTDAYNNLGNLHRMLGNQEDALAAYTKVISIKGDDVDAYYNMGIILQDEGKLEKALWAYKKALSLKPDHPQAYNNLGNVLNAQGQTEEAILAYKKSISIKPDYTEAYYNIGNTLLEKGKLKESELAYQKALSIQPDHSDTHHNLGNNLQEQGKIPEAILAYKKALSIRPDYYDAYRHLSMLTRYKPNDPEISAISKLLKKSNLTDPDRCILHYAYAKMNEDIGKLDIAYENFLAGGTIRKKILEYDLEQDEALFQKIKYNALKFKHFELNASRSTSLHTPIFILGMPRSGTTIVEQILSAHSEVTGAGELEAVAHYGHDLATDEKLINFELISKFRDKYLEVLSSRSDGKAFVTDKMPQNFRYIALLCAAFPESKIIHVHRNAQATCWSNFKQYFSSKGMGYSYDLSDTIGYYRLYLDLMDYWDRSFKDRIYNLDYERLTKFQELETRQVIKYLGLSWEDACLHPQNNKRSVKTASVHQVRKKLYQGSSEAWRKYEMFLDGAFDDIKY